MFVLILRIHLCHGKEARRTSSKQLIYIDDEAPHAVYAPQPSVDPIYRLHRKSAYPHLSYVTGDFHVDCGLCRYTDFRPLQTPKKCMEHTEIYFFSKMAYLILKDYLRLVGGFSIVSIFFQS